jgi:hypothetical protein
MKEYPVLDALAAQQARTLHRTIVQADISEHQLWWYYYGLGGDAGEVEMEACLYQALHLSLLQRNILDHAAHELITY